MRHFRGLDGTLGEDLLDDVVLVGRAEHVLEVLLARASEDSLRALAGVEHVKAVDDRDERNRAEQHEARG